MQLSPGTRVGPYEILSPIGAGGMGEVYKSRDTRLDRLVAVKISQQEFSARFEQEARAVAALNHSNICTLYDVGPNYLVMEYLEGDTLAERIALNNTKGPLPLGQALSLGIQIADALDAAHRKGIVHRDLKPANVMLTRSGAKLLDFGLARMQSAGPSPDENVTQAITNPGTILGTFQYMAPEQLEAKTADARSDIFALGAVLYEMLTGRKAFSGQSQASLISAIMSSQPPALVTLQPLLPASLDRVVGKCLAKDPDKRWQSANDLADELRWIAEGGSQVGSPAPVRAVPSNLSKLGWGVAALLGLALVALGALHWREQPAPVHPLRFNIAAPDNFNLWSIPALSPDSTKLVFGASQGDRRMLFLRDLNTLDSKEIKGTEGGSSPFWAPDGKEIGFFAQNHLKKVDLSGGSPITLAVGVCCGAWSKQGDILFSPATSGPLHRISADGGAAVEATRIDPSLREVTHRSPQFLPDGRHFLFVSMHDSFVAGGVFAGSLDSSEVKKVMPAEGNVAYVPPGILLFTRADALLAQRIDSKSMKLTGQPVHVAERVSVRFSIAAFSAADQSLVFVPGGDRHNVLEWLDRKGTRLGNVGELADYGNPALSPDGRTLAVCLRDSATSLRDIWLFDLIRKTTSRFTFDPADDLNPTWSPDGGRIAFSSARKGHLDLYEKAANGVGEDRLLLASDLRKYAESWSPDGKIILYNQDAKTVWQLPLDGAAKPSLVLSAPAPIGESHLSPDGNFIAYRSPESGRDEIYVQNYPPSSGRWPISNAGGEEAQWNPNGKELFYLQGDKLFAVDIKASGATLEAGVPHMLFEAPFAQRSRNVYVVSPDGKKFLAVLRADTQKSREMTVLINWAARLRK